MHCKNYVCLLQDFSPVHSRLKDSLRDLSASVRNLSGVLRSGSPRGAAEAVCLWVYMYTYMSYKYVCICMYLCVCVCVCNTSICLLRVCVCIIHTYTYVYVCTCYVLINQFSRSKRIIILRPNFFFLPKRADTRVPPCSDLTYFLRF